MPRDVAVVVLVALGASPPVRRWLGSAWVTAVERRRRRARIGALPEWCRHVARRLVVGETLERSIRSAHAALPSPAGTLVSALDRGSPFSVALARWSADQNDPELRMTASALGLAADGRVVHPHVFDRVAILLEERAELAAEVRSQSAQATSSALVVAALPWIVVAALLLDGGSAAQILLHDPRGRLCLAAALALELLGVWWMRWAIARVGP